MRFARFPRSYGALCIPCILVLAFLALGCGEDSTPSGPGATAEQRVQDGTGQLGDFVDSAGNTEGAQLLDSREFQELLNAMGAPAASFALPQPARLSPPVRRLLRKLGAGQHTVVQPPFGTYVRDPGYSSMPFPGWRPETPNDPPDGIVFRFDLDDGIVVYDDMGMPIPVRGEYRFLNMVFDGGALSGVVIEIAATPEATGSLPVLVRLDLQATFDSLGELQTLVLGNPQANNPGDPGASFIGPVLIAVSVQAGLTTADILVQVYDTLEDFVVRLDLSVTEDPASGLLHSANVEFGWGVTNNPTAPPWGIALDLDNFRMDPTSGGEIADVAGAIEHRNIRLATLSGDTSEVPVDLDGDEIPDINCVNVTVTFSDAMEEPQNLCQALPAIQELLGNGNIPKLVPLGGGWR